MKLLYTLLTIILLISNLNCKRIKYATTACNKKHRVEIPQRVKDYFYFKEGTYWVYQNQKTLAIDSHWVCDSYLGTKEIKGNSNQKCHCFTGTCYENMEMKILSPTMQDCQVYDRNKIYLRFFLTLDYNEAEKYSKNYFRFILETGRGTYGNIFVSDGSWIYDGEGNIGSEKKDTSNCSISGVNFSECILQREGPGIIYDHYKEVLMARGIGIISYRDTSYTKWNLIRSSIVK